MTGRLGETNIITESVPYEMQSALYEMKPWGIEAGFSWRGMGTVV